MSRTLVIPWVVLAGCVAGTGTLERPEATETDSDTDVVIEKNAEILLGPEQRCAEPARRTEQRFDRHAALDSLQNYLSNSTGLMSGGGVAAGDLDGDGLPELFLTGKDDNHLFRSDGPGRWVPADERLPEGIGDTTASVSVVDIDADGDLDLFLGRYVFENQVLLNDGTGQLELVSPTAFGIDDGAVRTTGQAWADFDADGDLDLFLVNYGRPNEEPDRAILYVREGDGFVPYPHPLPETLTNAHTFVAGWHDLDDDGWLDLYAVNDFGWNAPNPLLWNQGDGTFVQDEGAGLDFRTNGMGLGVGDLNEDGLPDFVVPAWGRISVGVSAGDRTWYQKQSSLGIFTTPKEDDRHVSWAAEIADMDNDTDEDVVVMFGHIKAEPDQPLAQPDALFLQGDDGAFEQSAESWGLDDPSRSRGMVVADLNDDGWLDVLKASKSGPASLYLSRCGEASWLRVQLRQHDGNPFAIGAKVEVTIGERTLWRRLHAGSTSLASGGPPEVHLGLGDAEIIDELVITWPDHTRSAFEDVSTRRLVTIQRL